MTLRTTYLVHKDRWL